MSEIDFARQLADYVDATTLPVDRPTAHLSEAEMLVLSLDRSESSIEKFPRRSLLAAATAVVVVVVVVGLVVAVSGSGEPLEPADQPSTPTTIVEPDLAALAEVGVQLTTALAAGDRSAAIEMVRDDATVEFFGAADRSEFELLFGWFAAADWQFELQECVPGEPDQVECALLQSNAWSNAVDLQPVDGTLFLNVENGQVTAMRYEFDIATWSKFAFGPFVSFVTANHADDLDKMWGTTSDGLQITGPLLTDSSFALFEQYSTDYATLISEGTASTTPTTADGGS